jgi:hypothetical protein
MVKSIYIATPMYGGNCSGIFAESLAHGIKGLTDLGYNVKFCPMYNESLITRARNVLTELFLRENYDYLLFIDADQSFDYIDIHKMVQEDKDILGALVPMKQLNWEVIELASQLGKGNLELYSGMFNINLIENTKIPNFDEPFEVKHIGTGMMLIKREVLLTLKKNFLKYKHNLGEMLSLKNEDIITEFWTTGIDEQSNLLSEDYNFCRVANKQGYTIYAVAYATIMHAGTYFFKGMLKN